LKIFDADYMDLHRFEVMLIDV